MWKIPPLRHPSTWFCLLGSALALVSFFLPYYIPPPESPLPPASLGDCLTSCAGLDLLFQRDTGFGVVALVAGVLLLLLLAIAVLAFLALFLSSPRRVITESYLKLTIITLISYTLVSLYALLGTWIDVTMSSRFDENPTQKTLSLIGVGSWLIAVALLLAVIGSILLARKNRRPAHKSELAQSAPNSGDD